MEQNDIQNFYLNILFLHQYNIYLSLYLTRHF
ncbi:unnamed protein product [Schistosoma curassoni]|uniref:Uncharacterized protein n=1 Tax=Schistosoma curassoni TaxID=6186 RepID=A0A183K0Y2_9TREM|nr:unnamed protein product [Schistosoma curassoni]